MKPIFSTFTCTRDFLSVMGLPLEIMDFGKIRNLWKFKKYNNPRSINIVRKIRGNVGY